MSFSLRFIAGLIIILLPFPAAFGQPGGGMDARAREILSITDPATGFDRVTPLKDCTVFERFSPPSFVVLTQRKGEILVAAYSRANLFFQDQRGSSEQDAPQTQLMEGLPTALRQQKGIRTFQDPVGPLVRTQWGQGRFFNYGCPPDPAGPNGHVLPGCMSVAMAQVVRYYGAYNEIDLQHSFQSGRYGLLTAKIGPYPWNRMDNTLVAVNREVCDMLFDFSVLLHTAYGATGSSANSHRTLEALHELGFSQAVLVRKADYSTDSWSDLLYSNLIEYQPVLVTGGGHAFICDGFDQNGMLHFNLGGAGYGDGYYMPGLLVLGYPVNEMFVDLYPSCQPALAKEIAVRNDPASPTVVWSPAHQNGPVEYNIYVDESLYQTTHDTLFSTSRLDPGLHTVHVSTLTPDGESRWIGPVDVFIRGNRLTVHDEALFSAFMKALGYGRDVNSQDIFEGDLSRIISLEITEPILSLEGIGLCKQLRKLMVSGFPGPGLDAGPLGNLEHLQVLELRGRITLDSSILGTLGNLSELRFFNCPMPDLDFLYRLPGLMKFTYCGVSLPNPAPLVALTELDELDLSQAGLSEISFAESMKQLRTLRLAGNRITTLDFLQSLPKLTFADISDNLVEKVVLTDQLQCLVNLDLHGNRIKSISASADLRSLEKINLSGNEMASPGRLLLYTPSIKELNLSGNRITSMGKYYSEQLSLLNLSGNQLITTDWLDMYPSLTNLILSGNRISDLSGLIRLSGNRRMESVTVDGNPLSKETFETQIPILKEKSVTFSYPVNYQPLSPCYPTPANGSRFPGNDFELQWVADQSCGKCVFDLYKVDEDTMQLIKAGLEEPRAIVDGRPSGVFKWMVASRTPDNTFYSGIYSVYPLTTWTLPYAETFENYENSARLEEVSEFWSVKGTIGGLYEARIEPAESRNGYRSLELKGSAMAVLPVEHIQVSDFNLRFSVRVPEGKTGQFRIKNLSGMEFRAESDGSGKVRAYLSDRLVATLTTPSSGWMDYRISANARNNQLFIWAGTKLIVSQSWIFPSGTARISSIIFNASPEMADWDPASRQMYVDDISMQSSVSTRIGEEIVTAATVQAYPNPCTGILNIELGEEGRQVLTLKDMAGRTLLTEERQSFPGSRATLSMESLPDGIYTLLVTSASGQQVLRIVKSQSGY